MAGVVATWAGVVIAFLVGLAGLVLGVLNRREMARANEIADANLRLARRVAVGSVSWKVSGDGFGWLVTNTGSCDAIDVRSQLFDVMQPSADDRELVLARVTPGSAFTMFGVLTMSGRDPRIVVSWSEQGVEKVWEHPLQSKA